MATVMVATLVLILYYDGDGDDGSFGDDISGDVNFNIMLTMVCSDE